MSVDRSMRNAFAALLLVAALFVAMNRIVASAPLGDWWLPLVLLIVGLALIPNWSFSRRSGGAAAAEESSLAAPGVRSYSVAAQPVPRLHTMTIRPDPETADYTVTVTDETGGVLPFIETAPAQAGSAADFAAMPLAVDMTPTPVSPETPAPQVEPEPEPAEPVPVSPETPTPSAPAEPAVESPETPTPDVPTEVAEHGPNQTLPVDRVPDISQPAPELKHSARSEYANPDEAVAKQEAPAVPPPDTSVTAPQRTEPEKDTVVEKTAAPQQPYEVEQVGAITPERADRVLSGSAAAEESPAVVEAASASMTAQAVTGEGVGSADDLSKLSGVGAKTAAALKAAGIDSYHKLANSTDETIRAALTAGGIRASVDISSWTQQAAYAARGDWDGLKQYNAGRKTPPTGD